MDDKLKKIMVIANNVLAFDDSSDYCNALWDILEIAGPELFKDDDEPELEYIGVIK